MKRLFLLILCLVVLGTFPERKMIADDDFSVIQNAITASIQNGANRVVTLESGKIYRLGTRPEASGALTVIGADGLTIDGNGATLLAHPTCMVFAIAKSHNVIVRQFAVHTCKNINKRCA